MRDVNARRVRRQRTYGETRQRQGKDKLIEIYRESPLSELIVRQKRGGGGGGARAGKQIYGDNGKRSLCLYRVTFTSRESERDS